MRRNWRRVRGIEGVIDICKNKKLKLILAWIVIHNDELLANWNLLSNGEKAFSIEPLK